MTPGLSAPALAAGKELVTLLENLTTNDNYLF